MAIASEIKNNIFNSIKRHLENCCPPMINKKSGKDSFELIGNIAVPYGYKKEIVPGMFFASVYMRIDMVSFHFFPCYMNHDAFISIAPTLFKTLKGKTCFNFKKKEQLDEKELALLLKKGIEVWRKSGYVA